MIEAHELTKRFGSKLAVDALSFTVRPGHVTGFLGPNGAGKSTTMRMIVGLEHPTSGTVTVNGAPYARHHRPLYEVGALLEVGARQNSRSAYNHLLWLAQSNGIARRRVDEVLDVVGLTSVARKRAGSFSLGMSQRLGIAAALLGDPPVVLCDEPVNGLDPEGIAWIRTLLKKLARQGRTVLVSSHLMSEMALTADHVIVIGRGRLIADCPMAQLVQSSSSARLRLRTPQAETFAAVLRQAGAHVDQPGDPDSLMVSGLDSSSIGDLATAHGLTIHELSQQNASLEDAYLELTRSSVEYRAADTADHGQGAHT